MSENGVDTSTFTGTLSFITSSSTGTSIQVAACDILTVIDPTGTFATRGLITPCTNPAKGELRVTVTDSSSDVVTATYLGSSASVPVTLSTGEGGGGGGGLVRPGLVLNLLAVLVSGGKDSSPPSFGISTNSLSSLPDSIRASLSNQDPFKPILPSNDLPIDYPLTIDDKGFLISSYASTIVTNTVKTGTPVKLKMLFNEASTLEHVALYTNIRGTQREISNSDTYIIYDKGKITEIVDPHGYFSDVKLDISKDGTKNVFTYDITFAKPMEKSDIVMRAWDAKKNSADNKIFDAWESLEDTEKETAQIESGKIESGQNEAGLGGILNENEKQSLQEENSKLITAIKKWGGYSAESASDSDLLESIGVEAKHIPSWVKKPTRWIVNGDLTTEEFINAIKYLHEKGIIK